MEYLSKFFLVGYAPRDGGVLVGHSFRNQFNGRLSALAFKKDLRTWVGLTLQYILFPGNSNIIVMALIAENSF